MKISKLKQIEILPITIVDRIRLSLYCVAYFIVLACFTTTYISYIFFIDKSIKTIILIHLQVIIQN